MNKVIVIWAAMLIASAAAFEPAEAAGVSKAVAKAAMQRALAKDMANHAKVPVRPLIRDARVWRYTTLTQARQEARSGIAPNSHMTARISRGRLPSGETARTRYGLIKTPTARMTVDLERGFPARRTKAVMGTPGVGELTSSVRVPPQAIVKIQALPK